MRSDRICRYGAAATAALAATGAHAGIVSATGSQTINQNSGLQVVFDDPGSIGLTIWAQNYYDGSFGFVKFAANTSNASWFNAVDGASITANTLNASLMGSSAGYGNPGGTPAWVSGAVGYGADRLMGFKLRDTSGGVVLGTYAGWINYSVTYNGMAGFNFVINDWAINTTSGGSIIAGQHSGSGGGGAVPGLGGLAALACGAAGVRSRRQRVA